MNEPTSASTTALPPPAAAPLPPVLAVGDAVGVRLDPVAAAAVELVLASGALGRGQAVPGRDQVIENALRKGAYTLAWRALTLTDHRQPCVRCRPCVQRQMVACDVKRQLGADDAERVAAATVVLDPMLKAMLGIVAADHGVDFDEAVAIAASRGARALGAAALPFDDIGTDEVGIIAA